MVTWVPTLDEAICFLAAEAALLNALCYALQTAVSGRLFFELEFSHLEVGNRLDLCWGLSAP